MWQASDWGLYLMRRVDDLDGRLNRLEERDRLRSALPSGNARPGLDFFLIGKLVLAMLILAGTLIGQIAFPHMMVLLKGVLL